LTYLSGLGQAVVAIALFAGMLLVWIGASMHSFSFVFEGAAALALEPNPNPNPNLKEQQL